MSVLVLTLQECCKQEITATNRTQAVCGQAESKYLASGLPVIRAKREAHFSRKPATVSRCLYFVTAICGVCSPAFAE
jgi:hypothetical protein